MGKTPEKANDNLIMAIIIHIYVGWGFLFLIDSAVGHLTYNAYMGLIPALLIILPFLWIAYDLARIYQGQSITQIFGRVFGRFAGTILGVIYLSYLTFFVIISLRMGQLMVYSYFFERTPFILIITVIILGGLYPALKGVESIGRLASFMLIPPVAVIFLLEVLGLFATNTLNLRPVLTGTPAQWLMTGLNLTNILIPGTAIFLYMQFLHYPQSIKKISLGSLLVVIPLLLLGLIGTIGTLGPTLTKQMGWAVVEFFHIIDYPYLLLEQAGLFFLIAWYAITYVSLSQGLFIIGNNFSLIFPKINRKWFIIAVTILVFGMVYLPLNIVFLEDFFKHNRVLLAVTYLGLLLITWAAARLRARKTTEISTRN